MESRSCFESFFSHSINNYNSPIKTFIINLEFHYISQKLWAQNCFWQLNICIIDIYSRTPVYFLFFSISKNISKIYYTYPLHTPALPPIASWSIASCSILVSPAFCLHSHQGTLHNHAVWALQYFRTELCLYPEVHYNRYLALTSVTLSLDSDATESNGTN